MTLAAGYVGITARYTPDAAETLTRMGDTLRAEINTLFEAANVASRLIGIGSLMNLHITDQPIRAIGDIDASTQAFKDLFFFQMLEQGIYLAKRGYVVLSLPNTDSDLGRFTRAVTAFIAQYAAILPRTI